MGQGICKKCSIDFEVRKGFINYCSTGCRDSRVHTDTAKSKMSIASKKKWDDGSYENLDWKAINNNKDKVKKQKDTWISKSTKAFLNGESIHIQTIRKLLLDKANHTCEICKISHWMGKEIALEIHHVDGNNKNNDQSNLQVLCLNCHGQTHNYRAKNIKTKIK